jgi:NADPH:quinone reductase-like Zn-dependent oxidoreductase
MGVVEAVGPGAAEALSDQRVAIFFPAPGAWSETVTVPASFVVPVPRGVADDTAALMLVNPITALTLLRAVEEERGGRGGLVVQTAAGSSVGRLLGAEALRRGIPMVNLVRSTAGARVLRQHQPELATISTADEDWRAQVRDAADGQEVRVVLDAVGGSFTADLIGLLADGSTLITYEQLGSGSTPLESLPLTIRELTVRGVSIGRWSSRIPEERAGDIGYATRLAVDAPELLGVAARYDLADFGQAIDHVSRPGRTGTVLLTSPLS